jgi:hypothetical protein
MALFSLDPKSQLKFALQKLRPEPRLKGWSFWLEIPWLHRGLVALKKHWKTGSTGSGK